MQKSRCIKIQIVDEHAVGNYLEKTFRTCAQLVGKKLVTSIESFSMCTIDALKPLPRFQIQQHINQGFRSSNISIDVTKRVRDDPTTLGNRKRKKPHNSFQY